METENSTTMIIDDYLGSIELEISACAWARLGGYY